MSSINQNSNVETVPSTKAITPTVLAKIYDTLESTDITINDTDTTVGSLISHFLNDPKNEFRWNCMDIGIKKFLENNQKEKNPINGLRTLVCTPDGTVAYDSSRDEMTNTFSNYKTSDIGENHLTRAEMLIALLGRDGHGVSERLSKTTSEQTLYYAERLGVSTSTPLGFTRVSTILKNE
jgi:hypothetical protein